MVKNGTVVQYETRISCEGMSVVQGDTKKWKFLKCVMAAMYSWQHCGTGTLSYRQPRHLVTMDQWNGQQRAVAIKMFNNFRLLQFC
jgi:hypothetical protein